VKVNGKFLFLFICFQCSLAPLFGQRVGLVLSGGGARGLAHIGVIRALEENHIPIDYIAGTSAGAVIGAMYAQGLTPDQMDSIVKTDDFYNWATGKYDEDYSYYFMKKENNASWINLKFSMDSIIQTQLPTNLVNSIPIDYALMEATAGPIAKANYNFDSLFVPFRCVASDIESKQSLVFRGGDLAQAVRASSAFPFYFRPVLFENKILYDGGLYNNFPADVMLEDFQPDMIIGVNAGGSTTKTSEENIVSQIRTMMTTPTKFDVICENGVLIEPYTDPFGLFDFSNPDQIVFTGYDAAMKQMDQIKTFAHRRTAPEVLTAKRKEFKKDMPHIVIDSISVEGINGYQAEYVRNILKPGSAPIPIERLRASYFQLATDDNIKALYPTLKYNQATGYYDMHLRVTRQRDLVTQFGGNISSRPISEAFVSAQYNLWRSNSYSFGLNFYFGKLYSSGQFRLRMDVPSRIPYYLEVDATINQWDFYRSSTEIFSDKKPSYLLTSDYNYGLNFGLPVRNKGKFVASPSYIQLSDQYYQTPNFVQADTADNTDFDGGSFALLYERSTLNRKQYANQGTFFNMKFRGVAGQESTIPGSTSVVRDTIDKSHQWIQFNLVYDNYFKRKGRIRLGVYAEAMLSNQPFLSNYTASILSAPSFEPINEMKTLFLPNYHAYNYFGVGSKNVIVLTNSFDLRIEGYLFQPYQAIYSTTDLKAEFGEKWAKRYFIGSGGAVYHSPIGPIGLFLNYYDDQEQPFSLLFHIGYFIFNKGALD